MKTKAHRHIASLLGLLIATLLALGSKDSEKKDTQGDPTSSATENQTSSNSVGPAIKGLSIGMDFQEAIKILKDRVAGKNAPGPFGGSIGTFNVEGPYPIDQGPLKEFAAMAKLGGFTGPYVAVMPGFPAGGIVRADDKNAVVFISFTAPLLKTLFEQASSLDFQDFAEEFANAYGLVMEPTDDGDAYETRLPEGVLVRLGQDFSLRLEKTQSSSEVKSAFD